MAGVKGMKRKSQHSPSLNLRARRVEVPAEIRQVLARLGRIASVRLFGISECNYFDAVSPGGRVQEKTLEKVRGVLDAWNGDREKGK